MGLTTQITSILKGFKYLFGVTRLRAFLASDDWSKLEPKDVLYLAGDANRPYVYQGTMYAPLVDTVREALVKQGFSAVTIARPFNSAVTHDKSFGYALRFNRSFAFADIKQLLAFKFRVESDRDKYTVDLWTRILLKVQPRAVIATQPTRQLCIACKKLGIFVADLQHGVISEEIYYVPDYWMRKGEPVYPSCFLLWNRESSTILNRLLPDCNSEHLIIGNPWFRRFIASQPDDGLVREAVQRLNSSFIKGKLNILVTMQWGIGIKDISISIPPRLADVIRRTASDYQWLIRLHPAQMTGAENRKVRNYLQDQFGTTEGVVEWEQSSELPLPLLLLNSALHITFNSASAIDASLMGVKTGLLDSRKELMESWFGEYMKSGMIEMLPEDSTLIEAWIKKEIATCISGKRLQLQSDGRNALIAKMRALQSTNL